MELAEIRERHRLRLFETKLNDCLEERHEISEALFESEPSDSIQKLRYESRFIELGIEVAKLWTEYRKLALTLDYPLTESGDF
jgi:hypothetical protein